MSFVSYCFWHPSTAHIFGTIWPISMGFSAKFSCKKGAYSKLKKMKTEFDRLQTDFAWSYHIYKNTKIKGLENWKPWKDHFPASCIENCEFWRFTMQLKMTCVFFTILNIISLLDPYNILMLLLVCWPAKCKFPACSWQVSAAEHL